MTTEKYICINCDYEIENSELVWDGGPYCSECYSYLHKNGEE
jgi:hypothetical protein